MERNLEERFENQAALSAEFIEFCKTADYENTNDKKVFIKLFDYVSNMVYRVATYKNKVFYADFEGSDHFLAFTCKEQYEEWLSWTEGEVSPDIGYVYWDYAELKAYLQKYDDLILIVNPAMQVGESYVRYKLQNFINSEELSLEMAVVGEGVSDVVLGVPSVSKEYSEALCKVFAEVDSIKGVYLSQMVKMYQDKTKGNAGIETFHIVLVEGESLTETTLKDIEAKCSEVVQNLNLNKTIVVDKVASKTAAYVGKKIRKIYPAENK